MSLNKTLPAKLRGAFSWFAIAGIAVMNHLIPKRRVLLLHAFPDVEDQMIAVLRWLAANPRHGVRVQLLVRGAVEGVRGRLRGLVDPGIAWLEILPRQSLAGLWAYWRADTVLITHGIFEGPVPRPRRQTVINLWHGMPIKAIWKANNNATATRVTQCDFMLSTSSMYSDIKARISGIKPEHIVPIGLPRNDTLVLAGQRTSAFASVVRAGVRKVAVFMPTFRQTKERFKLSDGIETSNPLYMSEEELSRLLQTLRKSGTRMLVKPHPMSIHYGKSVKMDELLWIITDEWLNEQGVSLYDALGQVDLLVTDISSVCIDFLVLDRPMIFYFPDYDSYDKSRGFVLSPLEDWLPGRLCTQVDQLLEELDLILQGRDASGPKRARIARLLIPNKGADATPRLFALIGQVWRQRGGRRVPANWRLPPVSRSPEIVIVTPTMGTRQTLVETCSSVARHGGGRVRHVVSCPAAKVEEVRRMVPGVEVVSDGGATNLYAAINHVLLAHAAECQFVGYINDDDCWLPGFEILIEQALTCPSYGVYYGRTSFVDQDGTHLMESSGSSRYQLFPVLAAHRIALFTQQSALIRSDLFLRLRGFDDYFRLQADNDFWLRAITSGASCRFVDKVCSAYRLHPGQLTVVATAWDEERGRLFQRHALKQGGLGARLKVLRFRMENLPVYWRRAASRRNFLKLRVRQNLQRQSK